MHCMIRKMEEKDKKQVMEMMRAFYSSPAVFTNGSEEIFEADINHCVANSPYLEGYVFENTDGLQGYAMIAKSFSTEFGKPCIWIEDLYVKNEYRGHGIGNRFLKEIESKYPGSVFRLEVEAENERAVNLYQKSGYTVIPYMEMKKEADHR